jgi:hypothetical protein
MGVSVVVPSASRSTNSDSGGSNYLSGPGRPEVVNKLIISAIAGATLTVLIEHSMNGASGWTTVDAFPAQTTTTTGITRQFSDEGRKPFLRVSWTITGGSATFTVLTALTPSLMLAG